MPSCSQPGALLPGGELDVGARPPHRPAVLVVQPVEPGAALPVLPGQLERVVNPQAALLGGVDEEQPAERPERLAAEVGRAFLVDQGDPLARARQLGGGDQTGEAGADHDASAGASSRDGDEFLREPHRVLDAVVGDEHVVLDPDAEAVVT